MLLGIRRVQGCELAPVDPRSLMQGDHIALRFKVATEAFPGRTVEESKDGRLVVALDERGVAGFKRFVDTTPLAANEVVLRYRIRNDQVKFAANAFFFEVYISSSRQGLPRSRSHGWLYSVFHQKLRIF